MARIQALPTIVILRPAFSINHMNGKVSMIKTMGP